MGFRDFFREADYWKLAEECYDTVQLRSIMSMLVHCTYFRDLHMFEQIAALLLDYYNERAELYGRLHWKSYRCQAEELELKDLGLAFYRPRRSHRNRNAPRLAIVLRGTIPTRALDLLDDLRIGLQRLNQSRRVLRTVQLILEVVERFRDENPDGQICMAGHSLGAAIALIVGGTLYSTYRIDIDTHLFNPPMLTVVHVLTGQALPAQWRGTDHLGVDFTQLKQVFVQSCGNQSRMNDEWKRFKKLRKWIPHFYLNPGDPVSFRYIDFYNSRQEQPLITPGGVISSQGVLSGLFNENATHFRNVVPSADLHISHWQSGHFILSHSLKQWHKYKAEYIQLQPVLRARLLRHLPPRPRPRRHYRHY